MTTLAVLAACVGFLMVQTTLLDHAGIAGIKPDLILVTVYLAGFRLGEARGAAIGAVSGLLMDLLSAGPPGLNMATKTAEGLAAGLVGRAVLTVAVSRHMITLGLLSIIHGGMTYGIIRLLDEPPAWWSVAGYLILPQAVYDGLIGGTLAWVVSWRWSSWWNAGSRRWA